MIITSFDGHCWGPAQPLNLPRSLDLLTPSLIDGAYSVPDSMVTSLLEHMRCRKLRPPIPNCSKVSLNVSLFV